LKILFFTFINKFFFPHRFQWNGLPRNVEKTKIRQMGQG
jgi:hypothetical protein